MNRDSRTPTAPEETRRSGRHRPLRHSRVDGGAVTAEVVVLAPVLVLMLWFIVYCIRLPDALLRIEDAAHQATRAASQARDLAAAEQQARSTASAALDRAGVTCQSLTVDTHGSLRSGSTVRVRLACTVGLRDLALLRLPGTTTVHATFAAPVDVYRGTALGDAPPSSAHTGQETAS